MEKTKEFIKEKGMPRRSFLKLAGLSSVGLSLGFPLNTKWAIAGESKSKKMNANWLIDPITGNKYFVQNDLLTQWANEERYVLARHDGWWWAFQVREFNSEFHDWWIAEKTWYYDQLIAQFEEGIAPNVPNGGHHHPMLTTYGAKWFNRGDSQFHLNTTPKGFTIIPKPDQIDYVMNEIQKIYDDPNADLPVDVFKKRRELYQNKDLWDKSRFATLELYTGRPIDSEDTDGNYGFNETHTFQNIMENSMATLTYMSLYNTDGTQSYFDGNKDETPTFEFRGFCWLISYYNPNLTENTYEKKIADYINQAHCGYHGGSCHVATNIFLITEEFNNSPGYAEGRGKRVVPEFSYGVSNNMKVAKTDLKMKNMTRAEKMELLRKLRIPV
jgi:hypothetical protein